ncbi:hypothetical protein [Mariniflexile sp.]|uniref:hypothetical protein n=1 Tax=Mariniflexile sp. TaxID=1979402 RepID=UPI0040485C7D
MDELDILKKDWNKEKPEHKKLSTQDIYPMLHKKSSSIAKTLFYISIAELVFWILINTITPYFYSDEYKTNLDTLFNEHLFTAITIFSYLVIILFIYLLFKAQKSISATDSAKKLMESILNTRKIIKFYVIYNLVMIFITFLVAMVYGINHDPKISSKFSHYSDKQLFFIILFSMVVIGVFMLVIWLFYKLLYGLLLKRLNQNYKELKKLEV